MLYDGGAGALPENLCHVVVTVNPLSNQSAEKGHRGLPCGNRW